MIQTRVLRTSEQKHQVFAGQLKEMETSLVYFDPYTARHRSFIAAMDGEQVIGLAALKEESTRIPGAMTITFVSVREDRRNQGVAKLLVDALFDFAEAEGKALANTQYEEEGLLYLKPALEAAASRRPHVGFHEFPVAH
ncbi:MULTISPECIES: GNAT family N-acetyltransferase [unclassified Variovorax]|uniref:GNAT family N-acetyltransferase n=1 Tax=unclassified Variovorax TaxID=663243 RepID=UPI00076C8D31|nr:MULTISPECIES: GNAT family N-acetyltransferase [unclassified Variovorax]KWT98263.1 hypothetical protein APY03_0934 [Variovorax sp. WDL1]PNG50232.1 hypothetical protein CHC06_05855 [Variovorax sp. B2]PNG51105.1 hypothetical protein CHC07_05761 [Variovorax sp. B4]VTU42427.1 Acetyltransferase (GNAT) family protein [Variovorax sp. SRS16]VTU42452.1 Acetyltransferase (GNAT) family protein [Variovorax sp. PBL-E5]